MQAAESALRREGVRLLRGFLWLVIILLSLVLVATVLGPLLVVIEIPFRLGAGWAFHLQHTLPEVRWSPEMIVSSVIAILVAAFSLNVVAGKLCKKDGSTMSAWSWHATTGVTLGVAVLFGSAICGAGIVHQVGWLTRTKWISDGYSDRLFGPDASRARQLVMLAKSFGNQAGGQLPEHLEDMRHYVEEGDLTTLLIPMTRNGEAPEPWIYLGSKLSTSAPGWLPVLAQPRPTDAGQEIRRVVFSLDGQNNALNEEEYQALLSRWRAYRQEKATPP